MSEIQAKKRIWGLEYEEYYTGEYILWRTKIRNPFMINGHYQIGLNIKFFREAWKKGVEKLVILIGEREIMMNMPDKKVIRYKEKMGEYEDRKSLFEGSPDMRIFLFNVPKI